MLEKILAAITTQYAIHFSLIKLFKNTDRFDFFPSLFRLYKYILCKSYISS